MKIKVYLIIAAWSISVCNFELSGQKNTGDALRYSAGLTTGYNRGFGLQGNLTLFNFESGFPFQIRMALGYNFLNPGNAADARRIFVNNNTNGTPEKKGHSIDYRLDLMVYRTILGVENSFVSFGPRFSTFLGDFKYVGGNEDFEVRSHQWGVGADLENHFGMMPGIEFIINYGLDFFFPSALTGHDTSYSPDNDNVNPRNDNQNNDAPFRYKDADKAVNQPRFMPHIMLGLNFFL